MKQTADTAFADRLLTWWTEHGRHDLPWQTQRTPYRVWVSEIMLQQTQVATVIPYFERFMARFPTLADLAAAPLDDVLALWSGLGYYARARNLHRAAQVCRDAHGGQIPETAEALMALPGIGPSTAHAILAQAWNQRAAILDGNVKRVMARHAGIEGWPGKTAVLNALWQAAEQRTPKHRAADYTQAIMDLGAGICTARKPSCLLCPVHRDCIARETGRIDELPGRKPRAVRREREALFWIIQDPAGRILLQRRPPSGIWGGLWAFPDDPELARDAGPATAATPEPLRHEFTHFRLLMRFERRTASADAASLIKDAELAWFSIDEALAAGLPKPIRSVIEAL